MYMSVGREFHTTGAAKRKLRVPKLSYKVTYFQPQFTLLCFYSVVNIVILIGNSKFLSKNF